MLSAVDVGAELEVLVETTADLVWCPYQIGEKRRGKADHDPFEAYNPFHQRRY